jgi:hypothetical protein
VEFAGYRQNQSGISRPIFPPFPTRSAGVDGDVGAFGGEGENVLRQGKLMANYSSALDYCAAYLSHTGRPDWALVPAKPAQRLNTTTNNNCDVKVRGICVWVIRCYGGRKFFVGIVMVWRVGIVCRYFDCMMSGNCVISEFVSEWVE